ncbi:c-type cytochrome, partial [Roseivivax sp. CAU 1761]
MKLSFAVNALLVAAGCVREGPTAGRMLYAEHCAACHGPRAKGDGHAASGLAT